MNIYLFFKKYYIAMWNNLAIFLWKKWMTPNTASILSLFIIFPIFFAIYFFVNNLIFFTILIFFAINIKLILNAVDWIIARNIRSLPTEGFSLLWAFLNVWTDIWPDLLIIYLILNKIWIWENRIYSILAVVLIYLFFEFLVIKIYNIQNLFLWGKESRTFFYILILIVSYFKLNSVYLLYFYILIFIIHNVWFFITNYKK